MNALTTWTFGYYMPTEVIFGCGRVKEVGELVKKFGSRAILVTGPTSARSKPLYDSIKETLGEAGIEVSHFDGVVPNPTTDCVHAGAEMAKACHAEMVIGVGGGSPMDTAKAIAVEASHEGTAWDYLFYKTPPTEKTLPIITIGTTAGTGSQTTSVAVITNTADKDKSAISNRNTFPKLAIVDPELTASMPSSVTAQTGFDAFCHNFESYLSIRAGAMVEAIALDAIRRIATYLPRAVADGDDMEARTEMSWADTVGGISNACAGTTLPHGLSMQIGGHCPHITHGQALACVYPSFTRYTRPSAVGKFAAVARVLDPSLVGTDDETASFKCCDLIDEMLKKINLWIDLKSLDVTPTQVKEIAACGQVLGDYKRNPRVATLEEMLEMMHESYDRVETSVC